MFFVTAKTLLCEQENTYPYTNGRTHDVAIVANINRKCGSKDILFHLGNFSSLTSTDPDAWDKGLAQVKYLKPKVILIMGSNENNIVCKHFGGLFECFRLHCKLLGFMDVVQSIDRHYSDKMFKMTHHRCECNNSINLCAGGPTDLHHYNVSVKQDNLYPYYIEEIYSVL